MTAPLDLRAVEARHKETMSGFSSNPGVYVNSAADVPALLAHARALRAALQGIRDSHYLGPDECCCVSCQQGAAVLAAAREP